MSYSKFLVSSTFVEMRLYQKLSHKKISRSLRHLEVPVYNPIIALYYIIVKQHEKYDFFAKLFLLSFLLLFSAGRNNLCSSQVIT